MNESARNNHLCLAEYNSVVTQCKSSAKCKLLADPECS